jgi:hypothetical protein
VVFIKDLLVAERPRGRNGGGAQAVDDEEAGATVEGTGSGFVWDSSGHIVSTLVQFIFSFEFITGFRAQMLCERFFLLFKLIPEIYYCKSTKA